MKLINEIINLYQLLPENEQEIYIDIFGAIDDINLNSHKIKQIIYNILLWRTERKS